MQCNKCGTLNIENAAFCQKCGQSLQVNNNTQEPVQNVVQEPIVNNVNEINQNVQNPVNNQINQGVVQNVVPNNNVQTVTQVAPNNVSSEPLNYFSYVLNIFLKPFNNFKNNESKLNNTKNSLLFALIVVACMTVLNLLKTIIATVRVKSFSYLGGGSSSWQWENIKNIKFFELIFKNLLMYVGIIIAVTVIFFLGSLIVKKSLSFIKSLSITTTSMVPAVLGIFLLAPIGDMIWSYLGIFFSAVGIVFSLVLLYELMNNELELSEDIKIYFNLACFGILAVLGYYVYMNLIVSSISGGLNDIMNMINW